MRLWRTGAANCIVDLFPKFVVDSGAAKQAHRVSPKQRVGNEPAWP
jgi:hypothetical protein